MTTNLRNTPADLYQLPLLRFDFMLDDDEFKEHTRVFVPATTAADTQKCIKFYCNCLLESSAQNIEAL